MKKLGKILQVFQNDVIIKTDKKFDFSKHLKIIDKELREIGSVKEIFGPVNAPYISIRPKIKIDDSLREEPVYLMD